MYFNDVHIIFYIAIAILGAITGKIVNWANQRLPILKKVISLDFFRQQKQYKENYFIILANSILNIIILNKFGIQSNIIANLELIKYLILTPMLLSVFVIDYKMQIIPNRLNLTIFETGLIIAFLSGWSNVAITIDMLLGMLAGAGIFAFITILSKFILGKDSIGLGDVKLMGAIGLFFGFTNIVVISIIAFLLSAILSIILLITKAKKINEHMSFGPFIVIASFITILVPFETLIGILIKIFTLGLYNK